MKRQRLLTVSFAVFLWLIPSLVIAGSATLSWRANTESDLQEYRVYTGTASRTYGTPVSVGKATSYTVNNLQEGVTYFFAVTAVDTSDNESGFSQEVSKTIADTHAPAVALTSPTTGTTYETPQGTLDLRGTAADNVGVVTVRWSNSRGGSGTANGTTTWSVSGIALVQGQNVITVTARDQAGNEGTYTLTVTYNPPDTTAPNPPVGVTVE
jgi:fibronectin type 3 domain-containing protein